jgi:threonine/homoserine/homoserine lactone efflux protein
MDAAPQPLNERRVPMTKQLLTRPSAACDMRPAASCAVSVLGPIQMSPAVSVIALARHYASQTMESLTALAAYCAVMSGTPGPNNVMLATSGANFGYRRTLPYLFGINTGVFALTVAVCLGLGALFVRYPQLHGALKIIGALYLVYLSWKLAGAGLAKAASVGEPLTFIDGATFQLVNPKSWMKAATIATVFMPVEVGPLSGALIVAGIGMLIGFPLISVWTLFGVGIGRFLSTPLRLRVFNAVMALSLLVLATGLLI